MVEQIEVMVGFVSKPKVVQDGRAAMCVLRPPSKKELSKQGKDKPQSAQTSASSNSQSTITSSDSPTDKPKDSLQQWKNKTFDSQSLFCVW